MPGLEGHLVASGAGDADRLEAVLREVGDRIGALTLAVEGQFEGTRPSLDALRPALADALERHLPAACASDTSMSSSGQWAGGRR